MRDATDFDAFYAASVRRVTSQLYAMTGDRAEAEDAVQEAYARAWQHWARVRGYADPESWVRTVAWRISVSSWRKAMNRPAAQRQAIVLHHLVGLSVSEIAMQLRLPAGTVKARLARGRRALQPLLGDDQACGPLCDEGVDIDAR